MSMVKRRDPRIKDRLISPMAAYLKERRTSMGLSQDTIVAKTGYSHNQISRVENGKSQPSLRYIEDISQALGIRWTDANAPLREEYPGELVNDIGKMFFDAMSVKCDVASYAEAAINRIKRSLP